MISSTNARSVIFSGQPPWLSGVGSRVRAARRTLRMVSSKSVAAAFGSGAPPTTAAKRLSYPRSVARSAYHCSASPLGGSARRFQAAHTALWAFSPNATATEARHATHSTVIPPAFGSPSSAPQSTTTARDPQNGHGFSSLIFGLLRGVAGAYVDLLHVIQRGAVVECDPNGVVFALLCPRVGYVDHAIHVWL